MLAANASAVCLSPLASCPVLLTVLTSRLGIRSLTPQAISACAARFGRTPYAGGQVALVELGADACVKDLDGLTPRDLLQGPPPAPAAAAGASWLPACIACDFLASTRPCCRHGAAGGKAFFSSCVLVLALFGMCCCAPRIVRQHAGRAVLVRGTIPPSPRPDAMLPCRAALQITIGRIRKLPARFWRPRRFKCRTRHITLSRSCCAWQRPRLCPTRQ